MVVCSNAFGAWPCCAVMHDRHKLSAPQAVGPQAVGPTQGVTSWPCTVNRVSGYFLRTWWFVG